MRPTAATARRLVPALAATLLGAWFVSTAGAQLPTSEERLKILTDPESVKKTAEKDRARPPLELFRSQVAPFDILPYIKANHWSTVSLEMRANAADFTGSVQTAPVPLIGLPQEIVFHRDARLTKGARSRLAMQVMLPRVPKELNLELAQPDAVRPDEVWPASLRTLEPHQMLVVVLTKETSDAYARWNQFQALYPAGVERTDMVAMDRQRYYRVVLPLEPEKPPLSSHPLTWSTTSHVIWDGMPPDNLTPTQQQAMLDWLHWGGQLILIGGPGTSFPMLMDSFLGPYLPAEPTGDNAALTFDDLRALSNAYPPPYSPVPRDMDEEPGAAAPPPTPRMGDRYREPAPLRPPDSRPVFLAGLAPRPGSAGIPLGDPKGRWLGVERRVGRGRILMLGISLTEDPTVARWPGLDTFVRRVVLRRPEEGQRNRAGSDGDGTPRPRFAPLQGPDLTWVRYLSRDLTSALPREDPPEARRRQPVSAPPADAKPAPDAEPEPVEYRPAGASAAEWSDASALPRLCRDVLEEASGIKVPSSLFVLQVVLAYVVALVPLNWLVCRYVVNRRELAWVVVPVLAFGFAVAVERAAAYDIGYNSACDEVDVVEVFGDYPRAHVSRFVSLYTTGRTRYTLSYPGDPTALALPLDAGRSLRGEDVVTSAFRSYPTPALEGFLVQPRSLGLVRVEQMATLDGAIKLAGEGATRTVVNGGTLELRDAVLVDHSAPNGRRETYLGTIAPGATVSAAASAPRAASGPSPSDALRPQRFLKEFRAYHEDRPESRDEVRLVAWLPTPLGGQKIEPAVDRHRGFTAVVVRLKLGPPPAPDGPVYDSLSTAAVPPPPPPPARSRRGVGPGRPVVRFPKAGPGR